MSGNHNGDIKRALELISVAKKAGADAVRVGVGSGSLCSTRIQTGVGIPMVSAIRDVDSVCDDYGVSVIADGGIRTPGDVA